MGEIKQRNMAGKVNTNTLQGHGIGWRIFENNTDKYKIEERVLKKESHLTTKK